MVIVLKYFVTVHKHLFLVQHSHQLLGCFPKSDSVKKLNLMKFPGSLVVRNWWRCCKPHEVAKKEKKTKSEKERERESEKLILWYAKKF